MTLKNNANIFSLLLVCLFSFLITSCNKINVSTRPITLWYEYGNPVTDSENFSLTESGTTIELHIEGGDGDYKVSNSNDDVVSVRHDGPVIRLKPLIIGKSEVIIVDDSGNSYSLLISVKSSSWNISTYRCLIYGDDLTGADKSSIETEMQSLVKGYKFINNEQDEDTGVLKVFLDKIDGEEYDVYDFVLRGEVPESCTPVLFQAQIVSWWTLKSEKEETVLFITNYISPQKSITDTKSPAMTQYSLVLDVTSRFKSKYPGMQKAYIVQK